MPPCVSCEEADRYPQSHLHNSLLHPSICCILPFSPKLICATSTRSPSAPDPFLLRAAKFLSCLRICRPLLHSLGQTPPVCPNVLAGKYLPRLAVSWAVRPMLTPDTKLIVLRPERDSVAASRYLFRQAVDPEALLLWALSLLLLLRGFDFLSTTPSANFDNPPPEVQ